MRHNLTRHTFGRLTVLALVLALAAATAPAGELRSIRLKGGVLLRVGDPQSFVLDRLGYPHAQQGGAFFYHLPRKGTIAIEFGSDRRISRIYDAKR